LTLAVQLPAGPNPAPATRGIQLVGDRNLYLRTIGAAAVASLRGADDIANEFPAGADETDEQEACRRTSSGALDFSKWRPCGHYARDGTLRRELTSHIWLSRRSRPSRRHSRRAICETPHVSRYPDRAAEDFRISNPIEDLASAPRLERHRCARGGKLRTGARHRISRRSPALLESNPGRRASRSIRASTAQRHIFASLIGFRPRQLPHPPIDLAGCELHLREIGTLFEPDATMPRAYRGRRETSGEYPQ